MLHKPRRDGILSSAAIRVLHVAGCGSEQVSGLSDLLAHDQLEHICLRVAPGLHRNGGERLNGAHHPTGSLPHQGRIAASDFAQFSPSTGSAPPDLVQAMGLGFEARRAELIARRLNVPLVFGVDARDLASVRRVPALFAPSRRNLLKRAALVMLRPAWNIRFNPDALPSAIKAVLLPHAAANATRRISPSQPFRGFLAFMPSDMSARRLDSLLWAFTIAVRRHGPMRLDIVGPNSVRAVNKIRALAGQLGLGDGIQFRELLSHGEILKLLPTYRALLLGVGHVPYDGLPFEALFAGVPLLRTVGSDVPGFLAGVAAGPVVDLADVQQTSEALSSLHQENERYRTAISLDADKLFERFSRSGVTSRYHAALRSLLGERGSPDN